MAGRRSALADTGFFYDEEPRVKSFPSHVEILQQSMLDFGCHEFDSPPKRVINIRNEANRLADGGFKEDHWESFFKEHFFNIILRREMPGAEASLLRSSRCNYYYDNMLYETDALWGTFDKKHEGKDLNLVSIPKPDIVLYLPIFHLDSHLPSVTNPDALEWHKNSNPALVGPFSWSNLRELHQYGLLPTPFNVFDKKEEPKESYLRCYPWLVVEYKKSEKKYDQADFERLAEAVYCQAANASGCAVKLHQRAAQFALPLPRQAHIPPVPTVTTVGPQVKVWITYFDENFLACHWYDDKGEKLHLVEEGYMMQCIWEGKMTNLDDIEKFRLILENTHTWAARVFRPLISTYIEQWMYAYSHNYAEEAMARQEERLELSRTARRFILGVLGDRVNLDADTDLRHDATSKLVDLCDAFVKDVDWVIEEELEAARLKEQKKKKKGASSRSRRKTLTASQTGQARSVSPCPAISTPRSTPLRTPRKKPQTPTGGSSSRVKTAALDLKESVAGAEPKRRESGSELLDPSPAMIPGLSITHECTNDEEALVDSSSATSSSIDTPGDERSAEVSIPGAFPPMTPAKHVQSSVSEIIDGDDGEVVTQWQSLKGFASSIFMISTP
ncbi:hypothetical protein FAVG1_07602 [Fusarium avenaceum]|nr:hypothetical protein FAVG1_07602 [Fusarium avenaceum]